MSNFNIGDSVEVLPCGSQHNHCGITGRRGTVVVVDASPHEVGVHFPGFCGHNLYGRITTNTGFWCNPSWLRQAPQDRGAAPRFKVGDLLLSPEEQKAILAEGLLSDMTRSDALCRAQAAKVLAELVRLLPHRDYKQVLDLSTGEAVCAQGCAPCAVGEVIEAAGLTWPPKEGA